MERRTNGKLVGVLVALVVAASGCASSAVDCQGAVLSRPAAACTSSRQGQSVCVSSGMGYSCAGNGCWQLFADGVCTPPFRDADGGTSCFMSEPCGDPARSECKHGLRFECQNGCFIPTDTCAQEPAE